MTGQLKQEQDKLLQVQSAQVRLRCGARKSLTQDQAASYRLFATWEDLEWKRRNYQLLFPTGQT